MRFLIALLNHVPASLASRFDDLGMVARGLRALVNRTANSDEVVAVLRSGHGRGIRLALDPRREKYYWAGTHDVAVQDALVRLVRTGTAFWDVGAHVGFFTIMGARLTGPSGQVHAFEPLPANRRRLERTVRLNSARNVAVHDVALTDEDGKRVLHGHDESAMWTLIAERGKTDGVSVSCRSIDSLVKELGDPTVVKIDVEGAELDVLRGAIATIRRVSPKFVVEFANPNNVAVARTMLPHYQFEQLSDLDWLLSSSPLHDPGQS